MYVTAVSHLEMVIPGFWTSHELQVIAAVPGIDPVGLRDPAVIGQMLR